MRAALFLAFILAGGPATAASAQTVTATARSAQPGEVVELTITPVPATDLVRVAAFGHAIPAFAVTPTTWQALVGIDLDVRPGAHDITIEIGPSTNPIRTVYRLTVAPKAFPTRRLTVAEAFVNPPPEVQDRIAREAKRLDALWAGTTEDRQWNGAFLRPVPDRANSAFGSRSILNGQARSPHGGADFLSAAGAVVRAPNSGRVILADDLYYTGLTVVIDHGQGLLSLFAHLSEAAVAANQAIERGDIVGRVGATGRVTGPHLHWTVRLNGARVDPLSLLAVEGTTSAGLAKVTLIAKPVGVSK